MKKIIQVALKWIKPTLVLVALLAIMSTVLSLLWNGFMPGMVGAGRANILEMFWFLCFVFILKMIPSSSLGRKNEKE